MILDHITRMHIWHCSKDNHNKVWGYFSHGELFWAFWGGMGKAWSFKLHGSPLWGSGSWPMGDLDRLSQDKVKKSYVPITQADLTLLDPTWELRFNERFTYFLLMQPGMI